LPGITERVYPREMDHTNSIERTIYDIFTKRYLVAKEWLEFHFKGREIRILDMACGSGYGSEILSELGKVTGVDLDPEAVRYAEMYYSTKNNRFIVGNAEDYDFLGKISPFDAIVSMATLEHLKDPIAYLEWIRGALKPEGVGILCFPAAVTMDWAAPHHLRDISKSGAVRMFSKSGFRIKERFFQSYRLDIRELKKRFAGNKEVPVPPVGRFLGHYILNPHHLILRIYEALLAGGVRFSDQVYMILPDR